MLTDLFYERGAVHLRSDNGSEFTAKHVRERLRRLSVKPLSIVPGSPWENGYIESFIGKMKVELLDPEIFYSIKEAQVLIEMWRNHYNTFRPHSLLGYRLQVPATNVLQPSYLSASWTNIRTGTNIGGRPFFKKTFNHKYRIFAWIFDNLLLSYLEPSCSIPRSWIG